MDLNGWRKKIDKINAQLVRLLNDRARCSIAIGEIKRKNNQPVYDRSRENLILGKIREMNKGPLNNESLIKIFRSVLCESRKLQSRKFR